MRLTSGQRFWIKLILVLVLFAAGAAALLASGIEWSAWTPAEVRARILSWGVWAPVAYMAGYTIRIFMFVPASVMTLAGGLLFGPWWGTLYTIVGATVCGTLEFGVARWVGRETIERWLAGRARLANFDAFIRERGFWAVLILRLVPSVPFEVMNVSLGLSPVRWRDFLPATMLGMIPWTIAFGFMGEALTDFRNVWKVLLGILALVVVIWAPWLWRRRRARSP